MDKKSPYNSKLKLAKSLLSREQYEEALEVYDTLRKEYPDNPEPIFGAGLCLYSMNEYTQALGCFIKASELEPENPENYVQMGLCLRLSDQESLAIKQFEKALSIDDTNYQSLSALGSLYLSRERSIEAVDMLKKAVAIKPSYAENQAHLGLALAKIGCFEDAVKHGKKAIKLKPNHYVYFLMGQIYLIHGNYAEANKFFDKTLEIHPRYIPAYNAKTTWKITDKDRGLINRMENALSQSMPLTDRQRLLYSLGKAYNDIKEIDKAFTCIHKGNELSNPDYDDKTHRRNLRKLRNVFNKHFFQRPHDHPTIPYTPIFIVGMPRSGSTLLDQILFSHSAVFSGGESLALQDTISEIKDAEINLEYPACITKFDQPKIEKYRNLYFQKIAKGASSATHIVDKNLFNYEELGLIATLFPNAKIIHSKRHPLDTALSCYMIRFAVGLKWTNDLISIGKYYRKYNELMNYWHKTLPLPILDMQYEDMVSEPETNVRRLLEFCGLDWQNQCMDFYKSKRSVNTASIWQVRQPVYKSSVQRWVPYAKHLQPLILALGDLLEPDYDKLESLGLKHGPRHNNPINKISKLFR